MTIQFIEDIDKDVKNWQGSFARHSDYVGDPARFLPQDISVEKMNDAEYLKQYLAKNFYEPGKITEFKNWLSANVDVPQIQKDLEDFMGRVCTASEIKAYITVFGLGKYNATNNLFYIVYRSQERERKISGIYHELMHFIFHEYFWWVCRRASLSEPQINDLKESLTVLLNPILEKRGLPIDKGYPKHQELRIKLKELWESKSWTFEDFLNEVLVQKLVGE